MAGLDLTPARKAVEALMTDRCSITDDPSGAADDVLDPTTGELVTPADDSKAVWSGPCLLAPLTQTGPDEDGLAPVTDTGRLAYKALIPIGAPPIPIGAVLQVTSSKDRQLIRSRFQVLVVVQQSLQVARMLQLEKIS